jgi:hypothetical protein
VPLYKLEHWRQKAEAALDGALRERETDAATSRGGQGRAGRSAASANTVRQR